MNIIPEHVGVGGHVKLLPSVGVKEQHSLSSSRLSASHSVPPCISSTDICLVRPVWPLPVIPQSPTAETLHPVQLVQSAHRQFTVKSKSVKISNWATKLGFIQTIKYPEGDSRGIFLPGHGLLQDCCSVGSPVHGFPPLESSGFFSLVLVWSFPHSEGHAVHVDQVPHLQSTENIFKYF